LTFSLVSCVALLVVFTPGVKSRFAEVITSINNPPQGIEYNSTNIRKAIFDCSIKLIHSDYLKGVGFSNLQNKLTSCYERNYLSHFYYENQYMTHNYFFYILISSGIFGFLFFMLYVLQIVRVAFQIRCFVFSVFLINILLMSLIEDFMYRHYGGLFFNIILLLFIRHHEHLKTAVAQK
jgi:O-antigen ligase